MKEREFNLDPDRRSSSFVKIDHENMHIKISGIKFDNIDKWNVDRTSMRKSQYSPAASPF